MPHDLGFVLPLLSFTSSFITSVRSASAISTVARHRLRPRRRWVASKASSSSSSAGCQTAAELDDHASLWLPSESSTYSLGHLLGQDCRPADVLQLHGPLGAGKTLFARGYIHAAMGDNSCQVTSPTYLLTNTYTSKLHADGSRPTIYHMDLWRLDDASSRPIVDFEHVFRDGIALIEWPDRLKSLQPPERLDVFIDYSLTDGGEETPIESIDDPWGFGALGVDGDSTRNVGRCVRLVAHGESWVQRIEHLFSRHVDKGANGKSILKDSSSSSSV